MGRNTVRAYLRAVDGDISRLRPSANGRTDFARYLVDELGDSVSTAFAYDNHVEAIESFVGKPTWELDVDELRWFLRECGLHAATKRGRLVGLRAYIRFLLLEGRIDSQRAAALLAVRGPKIKRRMRRPMTVEEMRSVLDACRTPLDYRVVYPGAFQGLRVSDSAILEDAHFLDDRLAFTSVKTGKWLEVPLHEELARVKNMILSRSTTAGALKSRCQSLSHYTGIPFSTHTLRRTFARRHDDLGTQEGVVIELLGQEQVTVYRRHYAAVSWVAMTEAQARLSY
jgi:integrase